MTGTVYSKTLGMDWNYDIYLPKDYDAHADETYPIFYLLHGIFGNHRNLLERYDSQTILDRIMANEKQDALVVFVDGFNSFYIDQKEGQQMETAIMEDLIPAMEKLYAVDPNRSAHAIGGISMGGYGAARLALKYNDYFSKALLLSPAIWSTANIPENFKEDLHAFNDGDTNWSDTVYETLLPQQLLDPSKKNVEFYVISSKDDQTIPIDDVKQFVNDLKTNEIPVKFTEDHGEDHNWQYWEKAAKKGYKWLIQQFKS